jgi:hypothetical protein
VPSSEPPLRIALGRVEHRLQVGVIDGPSAIRNADIDGNDATVREPSWGLADRLATAPRC